MGGAATWVGRSWNMGMVVAASAAGTAFEWYDFFVFVPLASILAKTFFSGLTDAAAYIFALGAFATGFAFRPVGALIFGRIGDRLGRKGAFLVTVLMMGAATFSIGLLPSYAQVGIAAPSAFILLRIVQGIALGGEWGGAAIYIAEHSPPGRRGYMTAEAVGKPDLHEDARAGTPVGAAVCRVLPPLAEPEDRADGSVRRHGGSRGGVVHYLFLRPVVSGEDRQARALDGERGDDRARRGFGAPVRPGRLAVGPDRT